MEESFNEKQSLELITGMINKAKNQFSESGMLYLVWGFAVLFCSIAQFILSKVGYKQVYYVWFFTFPVYIYHAIFLYKKKRRDLVKTYTDEILGYVWLCFVICLLLMLFILLYSKKFELIYSAILVLYAIPTFLSGAILKAKLLIIGGICCWALACLSLFIPLNYHLLLISIAVLVAWIIPGLYLRNKYLAVSKPASNL
ncbi:MAG: hypothetical protein ACKVOM_02225 [Ferruginibacter sp.]